MPHAAHTCQHSSHALCTTPIPIFLPSALLPPPPKKHLEIFHCTGLTRGMPCRVPHPNPVQASRSCSCHTCLRHTEPFLGHFLAFSSFQVGFLMTCKKKTSHAAKNQPIHPHLSITGRWCKPLQALSLDLGMLISFGITGFHACNGLVQASWQNMDFASGFSACIGHRCHKSAISCILVQFSAGGLASGTAWGCLHATLGHASHLLVHPTLHVPQSENIFKCVCVHRVAPSPCHPGIHVAPLQGSRDILQLDAAICMHVGHVLHPCCSETHAHPKITACPWSSHVHGMAIWSACICIFASEEHRHGSDRCRALIWFE